MRQPLDGIDSKMYAWMRGEDLTRAFVMLAAFPRSPWQRDGHRLEHVISYQLDDCCHRYDVQSWQLHEPGWNSRIATKSTRIWCSHSWRHATLHSGAPEVIKSTLDTKNAIALLLLFIPFRPNTKASRCQRLRDSPHRGPRFIP